MGDRKAPTEFTLRRGKLIRRARESAKLSQEALADEFGKTRPWLSMLESGRIHQLTEGQCRIAISMLGLNPSELTQDPAMLGGDLLPDASFQARRVARAWDELPTALQEYIWAQIEAYSSLSQRQPVLAQIAGSASRPPPSSERANASKEADSHRVLPGRGPRVAAPGGERDTHAGTGGKPAGQRRRRDDG